ncbi:hypothetical protein [Streptomyces sp. NPDC001502]|uniref:aromatic-ring hydroxylase C-terminal domain-containing protein n=1 Tax=Streptomyces sp. NPDC001502 TaxID=3364578 RepID=UPI00369957B8
MLPSRPPTAGEPGCGDRRCRPRSRTRVRVAPAACPGRQEVAGLLVRPDGIVAWAGEAETGDGLSPGHWRGGSAGTADENPARARPHLLVRKVLSPRGSRVSFSVRPGGPSPSRRCDAVSRR